jgi:hypothetical protein
VQPTGAAEQTDSSSITFSTCSFWTAKTYGPFRSDAERNCSPKFSWNCLECDYASTSKGMASHSSKPFQRWDSKGWSARMEQASTEAGAGVTRG